MLRAALDDPESDCVGVERDFRTDESDRRGNLGGDDGDVVNGDDGEAVNGDVVGPEDGGIGGVVFAESSTTFGL